MTHRITAAVLLALSATAAAAAPADGAALTAITHVDILPAHAAEGQRLLVAEAAASRTEPGCSDYRVLRQVGASNHFTLVVTWADAAARDAHRALPHVLAFRQALQPLLGSPFDEREHQTLP